jgi:hypothetical protein
MNAEMIWKELQLSLTQNGEQLQFSVNLEYPEYSEYTQYCESPEYKAKSIQLVQQDERAPHLPGCPNRPVASSVRRRYKGISRGYSTSVLQH